MLSCPAGWPCKLRKDARPTPLRIPARGATARRRFNSVDPPSRTRDADASTSCPQAAASGRAVAGPVGTATRDDTNGPISAKSGFPRGRVYTMRCTLRSSERSRSPRKTRGKQPSSKRHQRRSSHCRTQWNRAAPAARPRRYTTPASSQRSPSPGNVTSRSGCTGYATTSLPSPSASRPGCTSKTFGAVRSRRCAR